jgi:uridine kinase
MSKRAHILFDFSKELYEKLSSLKSGVSDLELYEFRYALENIQPKDDDWESIDIPSCSDIERKITDSSFYENIQLRPEENCKITIDESIADLNRSLFAGIVTKDYDLHWVDKHFYFDVRGFLFLPRTVYFTESILKHLGNKPFLKFTKKQSHFESYHGIGFRDFKEANEEIDRNLINIIEKLTAEKGTPTIIAIAGPTAAGKTEFSEYLLAFFNSNNKTINSIEMDNFFLDRDYRDEIGAGSMSKESIHFNLLKKSLVDLKKGKPSNIPKYDFINAFSSHDASGKLKAGASTLLVDPADVIFIEGNFPFLFDEIIPLIDIKVFYLTDDPIRLKRKWKRDIDYRKKYNPNYLCNRYFRTQFLKAELCYRKQLEICDIAVDTTQAHIYVSQEIEDILNK